MSRNVIRAVVLVAGTGLLQTPAAAGQELIAGWEGDRTRGYTFVTPVFGVTLAGPLGLTVGPAASFLYYDVPDAGGRTRIRSPGASIAAGLRVQTSRASVAVSSGYEIRSTVREFVTGAQVRERETGLTVQGTLFAQATRLTNVNAIVSYGDANQYTWARAGLKQQITNTQFSGPVALALGIEATAQGNDDIRASQLGGLFEIGFVRAAGSVQLRAGVGRLEYPDGTEERRPYFGIGFYRAF